MTLEENEAWEELERKQLNKNKIENEMKNKDLLFSHWYDSLEGTKSQGFAYKAWCAGWDASQKESTLQEISDIGQALDGLAETSREIEQTPDHLLRQSEREGWRYAKECEAEIKRLKELAEYRLKLLMKMPEQAEKQEPVMEVQSFGVRQVFVVLKPLRDGDKLYTTPPKREWVGLTDEEMKQICYEAWSFDPYVIARAIEAKLKEKNT